MAEHEPHDPPFDEPALSEALGTESAIVRDVAYGEGVQYSVGRGNTRLEIFPKTGVTRLTAPGVRIELFDNVTLAVSNGGVEFSRTQPGQDASLTLVPNGGVVFTLVAGGENAPTAATEPLPQPAASHPTPALGGPEAPQQAGNDRVGTTNVPRPVSDPPAGPQTARDMTSRPTGGGQPNRQAQEAKQERIQLTGRLGRVPTFRTTTSGSLVGRFPLAVHREDGHTTWHTVLAFGTRAEQLQRRLAAGELIRGREVDVVGYRHVNERPGKDGKPRQVQEVYAVAVKKR